MDELQRIIYAPLPDTTPETEAAALSTVYRFLLLDRVHVDKESGIRNSHSHKPKEAPGEPLRK